jgi:hypothetical protein
MTKFGHRISGPELMAAAFARFPERPALLLMHDGTRVELDERTPIKDQGQAGSCVAHAGCTSMEHVMAEPTPLACLQAYYDCRLQFGEQCVDEGSWPHVFVQVASNIGVCAEAEYPYDLTQLFTRPTDYSYQRAYDHRVLTGQALGIEGDIVDDIERHVRADTKPFGGWPVDDAFLEWVGDGIYDGPRGPSRGGHSMAVAGLEVRSDGTRAFKLQSSWRRSFGANGYVWVSEKFFRQGSDFAVFTKIGAP